MNLYATADRIAPGTGGGHVTTQELDALRGLGEVRVISAEHISPSRFGLPDSPFLADHLAADMVWGMEGVELAHIYSGTFSSTVRALKARGVKVSYTSPFHDRRVSMEEFARLGLGYPYPHIKDDRLWKVFIGGLLLADVVIAPSKLAAQGLRAEGCQRVEVIPHGCLWPENPSLPLMQFTAGYLGQCGPDKGILYLLQAWSKLNHTYDTLILAGPGTETLGPVISRSVNGGKFSLWGPVEKVEKFFDAISVYVQPSCVEAFGIPVAEAMSYGRPVIVSEGAGAADMVTEGVDGFIVPRRNPDVIVERIQWLKGHPNRMAEMGQRAREKARAYSWPRVRERYQALWNSLLSRG